MTMNTKPNSEFSPESKKIVLLGLDNAGKTSILKTIMREFDIIMNLRPTIQINRETLDFFGKNVVIWDYGGQTIYRKKYFSQPQNHFHQIAIMIYVVDIQCSNHFQENQEYFIALYTQIQKFNPECKIYIFYHKSDPTYLNFKTKRILKHFKKKFLPKQLIQEQNLSFEEYFTTIHDPVDILRIFSKLILKKKEVYKQFSSLLQDFCEKYRLLFGILFTPHYFEMGCYHEDEFRFSMISQQITELIKLFETNFLPMAKFELHNNNLNIVTQKFTIKNKMNQDSFHLVVGYDHTSRIETEELIEYMIQLNIVFKKILSALDLKDLVIDI